MSEEVTEKKVLKSSTGSGAVNLVIFSLAASLSGPMDCYGFEEEGMLSPTLSEVQNSDNSLVNPESLDRINKYTEDCYGNLGSETEDLDLFSDDLKFTELSQNFSERQVNVDEEIQEALNNFSKSVGSERPNKNRF